MNTTELVVEIRPEKNSGPFVASNNSTIHQGKPLLMPFLFLRQESVTTQQSCYNLSRSTEIMSTQFP